MLAAACLVARFLNQPMPVIESWRLAKLFTFADAVRGMLAK